MDARKAAVVSLLSGIVIGILVFFTTTAALVDIILLAVSLAAFIFIAIGVGTGAFPNFP